jgi:hypothetical protein
MGGGTTSLVGVGSGTANTGFAGSTIFNCTAGAFNLFQNLAFQPGANITVNNIGSVIGITANLAHTGSNFVTSSNVYVSGNITINGTGAISMPNRPAFRVYGAGVTTVSTTTNTTGILNGNNWAVDYQQGSGLNSTTGYFTAPLSGLYQVNLVARILNNTAPTAQIVVYKNWGSANVAQVMWESAANPTINHYGVSTISKLAVGDTLAVKVAVGSAAFDGNDNWSVEYIG